jgi:hypothetical protein
MKISERRYKLYTTKLANLDAHELIFLEELKNDIKILLTGKELYCADFILDLTTSELGLHTNKDSRDRLVNLNKELVLINCVQDTKEFQLLFLDNILNHHLMQLLAYADMLNELFYNHIMKEVLSEIYGKNIQFTDIYKLKND